MYTYPPYYRPVSPSQQHQSTIEVVGEGIVTAAPDRAVIVLGAVTEGPDLSKIQTENAAIISTIIQSLHQLAIPPENIQTTDYRIDIQYDYKDGKQSFLGYKVTHLLQITNDNIKQTGAIVDTAVASGANEVTSIRFTMNQTQSYELQALSLAIRNAQQKALTIAHTLGATLASTPYQVKELTHSSEPVPYMASKLAASAATPIQPGQLEFRARVQAGFHY